MVGRGRFIRVIAAGLVPMVVAQSPPPAIAAKTRRKRLKESTIEAALYWERVATVAVTGEDGVTRVMDRADFANFLAHAIQGG